MTKQDVDEFLSEIKKAITKQLAGNPDLILELGGLLQPIDEQMKKLNDLQEKKQKLTDKDGENFESRKNLFNMAERINSLQNPSYLDEFVRILRKPPFTLPSNYFQPETGLVVDVEVRDGNRVFATERMEDALQILFPGSVTYRYKEPKKVRCGQYYRDNTAYIGNVSHIFYDKPIFTIRGRNVFQLKILRTRRPEFINNKQIRCCPICFSMEDGDEDCFHPSHVRYATKPVTSRPISETIQIGVPKVSETKKFRNPLNKIFNDVSFLDELEIGVALTGFTRNRQGRTIRVRYDPFIGYRIKTKGILFKTKPFEKSVIEKIFEEKHLIRDIIVDIIFLRLIESLGPAGLQIYDGEVFLSGCIQALELDKIDAGFDYNRIFSIIKSNNWVDSAYQAIRNELDLYEAQQPHMTEDKIRNVLDDVKIRTLSRIDIENHISELLMNSLSHILFIASCFTSGSVYEDIDYVVLRDSDGNLKNEIMVFDSTNGSNGASQLIFDYLSLPEEKKSVEFGNEEILYRPKYLDEAISELLLPCQQGIADRLYYQSIHKSIKENLLKSKLNHLESITEAHKDLFNEILSVGIHNLFPLGIGLRRNEDDDDDIPYTTYEKRRELAGICIHGCPDCILLGNKSKPNQYVEKYSVSKYLLDILFRASVNDARLNYDSEYAKIEKTLRDNEIVILSKKIHNSKDNYDDLDSVISNLIGKKINGKFIKSSGFWIDCPISNPAYVEISYLLALV